ncbi:MAG: cyclic nucleotide-binding domain-containing protein, partial [Chloroflexota bacterium]
TILESLRNQIYVIELTGFLFFGTGNSIVTAIENRLADGDVFRYLLIDFRRVRGMDSSALLSLNKVMLMADQHDFDVYICDLANNERAISIIQGVNHSDHLVFADTLDSALGACETILLEVSGATQAHIPTAMRQQLVDLGMSKENAKALSKYMTREVHKPQETIIQQGDNADCVYLLEIGQVSIFVDSLDIDSDPDVHIGLRTMRFGTIIGEVGFVLKQKRSATIITDTDCIIWSLTHNDLERLREENPQLGFSFENVLLRILAKRLTTNNQLIQVLR